MQTVKKGPSFDLKTCSWRRWTKTQKYEEEAKLSANKRRDTERHLLWVSSYRWWCPSEDFVLLLWRGFENRTHSVVLLFRSVEFQVRIGQVVSLVNVLLVIHLVIKNEVDTVTSIGRRDWCICKPEGMEEVLQLTHRSGQIQCLCFNPGNDWADHSLLRLPTQEEGHRPEKEVDVMLQDIYSSLQSIVVLIGCPALKAID